ncbi:hypothetical protein GW17_00051560 [Ensete ventricosum]|nr:hypothetical protein GW17_00051560 [Ensete ventricosum]
MGLEASEVPTSNELLYLIVKVIAVLRVMAVILVVEQSLVSGWGLEEVFSSVEDGVEIGPQKLRESVVIAHRLSFTTYPLSMFYSHSHVYNYRMSPYSNISFERPLSTIAV